MRWFVMLLMPLALAGCAVGHIALPMTLGPSDAAPASCLSHADTPGDCKAPAALSGTRETNEPR
jgi:hypothetical protein